MLTLTITYAVWVSGGVWSTLKVVADLSGVVYAARVCVRVARKHVRKARERRELPFAEEITGPARAAPTRRGGTNRGRAARGG